MKWISKAISVAQFLPHLQQSELQESEKAAKKQTDKDHFVQADCQTEVTGKVSLKVDKKYPHHHTHFVSLLLWSLLQKIGEGKSSAVTFISIKDGLSITASCPVR